VKENRKMKTRNGDMLASHQWKHLSRFDIFRFSQQSSRPSYFVFCLSFSQLPAIYSSTASAPKDEDINKNKYIE
jgi:hypothetical protein